MQAINSSQLSSFRKGNKQCMADCDEFWFPEEFMEFPFGGACAPPAISQQETFDELLKMVDSMDTDQSPTHGIYAEDLDEEQNHPRVHGKCPQTPPTYSSQRPKTPPTTKPSFHELPPIISPDYMDRDSLTASPVNEAFYPPCGKDGHLPPATNQYPYHHYPHRQTFQRYTDGPCERSMLDNLAYCMRRSHASRREILRRKQFFGNHPSLYQFERLEGSHRRVWMLISSKCRLGPQPTPPPYTQP